MTKSEFYFSWKKCTFSKKKTPLNCKRLIEKYNKLPNNFTLPIYYIGIADYVVYFLRDDT